MVVISFTTGSASKQAKQASLSDNNDGSSAQCDDDD
jgi:hypothetical protein